MPSLHNHALYDAPLVSITDIGCRAPKARAGGEEHAAAHELVFTRAGVFVKHVAGREIVAEPAHVLFFNAHEPYRVSHPVQGGDDCTVLAFPAETIVEVIALHHPAHRDGRDAPFPHTHGPLAPGALLREQQLRRRLHSGRALALRTEEDALELLHETLRDACRARGLHPRRARAATARARRETVEAAKLVLASRPRDNPSLSALARTVNCSPFHLARLFRAEAGIPVHQYLLRIRMALALEQLSEDATNLSSLALDLGFSSHSHFTALFRRTFGVSPSDFRRGVSGARP
jgi:AraC family transcriptional regulator